MNKKERTVLAQNLLLYRKTAGLTQTQIADALGIDRSTYAYYEIGTEPRIEIIRKLAAIYKTSVANLLGDYSIEGDLLLKAPTDFNNQGFISGFNELSEAEKQFILKLRTMDAETKAKIEKIIKEN